MRFALGIILAFSASAAHARPEYDSAATVAYLVDLSSRAVLLDKQSRRQIPPASMAKMMTTYVVFDAMARGEIKPETRLVVSPRTWKDWNNKGSTMFLKPNEEVTVADLLHGVVTLSGNDASIVLAEGVAGSEKAFVSRMNRMARRLGMKNSRFGTANGWPDQGATVTTARDLALLGTRTISDFPELYRQYYGHKQFSWRNITQLNRNPILGHIAGADGLKTGHTDEAGYCFTGTAQKNGRRLVMVVAGLPSMAARAEESRRLLNWGFDAWRTQPLYKARSAVATLPVQLGSYRRIDVIAPRALALTLPAKDPPRYKLFVRFTGPVKAPFDKGKELAQLVAKFDNGSEQAMPLVAANAVARVGFFGRALNSLKSLVGI